MIFLLLIAVWDYSYETDIDFGYDNNIYAYSQPYIDDFLNGVRPYRFPFETYDDLVTSVDFQLLLRNRFFGRRTTTFNFDVSSNNYLVNNQKNFQRYTFGLRQSLGRSSIKVSYQMIPGYLIRYYRNPQGTATDYIDCEAAYHTVSGKLSYTTANDVTISAVYGHRWDDYIKEFNRYDARGHVIDLGIAKKLSRYLDLEFGYTYRISRSDSAGAAMIDTVLTPDGSFYQHSLNGNLRLQTVIITPTILRCSYGYGMRYYTSSDTDDILHFGRRDHRHRISISSQSRILTGVRLKFFFTYQWRKSHSDVFPPIAEIKDYNKYQAGAGLQFYH
ncbi:hypothetical protein IBX73_00945 [candidate division WOR-3 bacterium]|nr:hypothetical protein [candidate division WOR-3 bacterium]